jgi:hypothetical protein
MRASSEHLVSMERSLAEPGALPELASLAAREEDSDYYRSDEFRMKYMKVRTVCKGCAHPDHDACGKGHRMGHPFHCSKRMLPSTQRLVLR